MSLLNETGADCCAEAGVEQSNVDQRARTGSVNEERKSIYLVWIMSQNNLPRGRGYGLLADDLEKFDLEEQYL